MAKSTALNSSMENPPTSSAALNSMENPSPSPQVKPKKGSLGGRQVVKQDPVISKEIVVPLAIGILLTLGLTLLVVLNNYGILKWPHIVVTGIKWIATLLGISQAVSITYFVYLHCSKNNRKENLEEKLDSIENRITQEQKKEGSAINQGKEEEEEETPLIDRRKEKKLNQKEKNQEVNFFLPKKTEDKPLEFFNTD